MGGGGGPNPHDPLSRSAHVKNSDSEVNLLAKGVNSDVKRVNSDFSVKGQLFNPITEFSIILLCMVVKWFKNHIPFQMN